MTGARAASVQRKQPTSLALLSCLVLLSTASVLSQAPPSTDIWIVDIVEGESEVVSIGEPFRVTDRAGYDNQPAFFPDGLLAFTSMNSEGETDILAYDLESGTTRVLIATPENEYSATPVPGRAEASIIRDYGNQDQQLWSIPLGDGPANGDGGRLLLPDINPVGYHAWVDEERLLLFVLGEPPTLRIASIGPTEGRVLTRNPGRALARVPGSDAMSFVEKIFEDDWWLSFVEPETGDTRLAFRTLPGREDFAWSPSGWVFMADGTTLYRRRPGTPEWQKVANLAAHGLGTISRLAFDESGRRLALVGERIAD